MSKVNLDALIPREDFEILDENKINIGTSITSIDANGLRKDSLFYTYLRKPDFQRETNEWEPKKIVGLIQSFLNGDLIPSIILWHSTGNCIFVIDGGHRLSAILAWINDDYGDGPISKSFFGYVQDEQVKIADKTRKLINNLIGPYSHYTLAATNPKDVKSEIVEKSKFLAIRAFQLQWVNGDVKVAEQSFLTINQEATPINPTERKLIESRKKPNCIVARAIRRSGTGHKYWLHFNEEKQHAIEVIAKEINDLIFIPPFKRPVKSLEFPIAGNQNSGQALQLILNFVNITNDLIGKKEEDVQDDPEGNKTLELLQKCKRMAQKIRSNEPFSLGLHPIIYFYSKEGNHKIVSFYAVLALMLDFDKDNTLQTQFIKVRKDFEDFLLQYDQHISQIVRKYRQGIKGYLYVKQFYVEVIQKLIEKKSKEEVINYLQEKGVKQDPKEFSVDAKSAIFIKDALENAQKCSICNGLIDSKSITIDHIQRKREDGLGTVDNGQITHPYCNTTFKN